MGYMFRLYRVIEPSKTTDPIITRWSSALWDPQCLHNSIITIQNHIWYLIIILANITIIYSFGDSINMKYKLLKIYI